MKHKHLIIRAETQHAPTHSKFEIEDWFCFLVQKKMNMKLMFGPRAEYCEKDGNRGMTCIAIIETSHVVLHTWDECVPYVIQFDIYTCSDLNVGDILWEVECEFSPTKIEYKFLDRENDLTLITEGRLNA